MHFNSAAYNQFKKLYSAMLSMPMTFLVYALADRVVLDTAQVDRAALAAPDTDRVDPVDLVSHHIHNRRTRSHHTHNLQRHSRRTRSHLWHSGS